MPFLSRNYFVLFALAISFALAGCSASDQSRWDDEKEPHFVLGKNRVNTMDYSGAIEAFQDSLEVNPRSAQAHYQLAMLFENKVSDPAAAIYHYQQYLKFDPKAENPDIITQHINGCKQQLATDVLQLPSTSAAQKELERLAEENRRLHEQMDRLNAYYAAQLAAAKSNSSQTISSGSATPDDISRGGSTTTSGSPTGIHPAPLKPKPVPIVKRTHVVAQGETLAAIARKSNVSLAALQTANPGVSPKKLRVGQVLNLPPS